MGKKKASREEIETIHEGICVNVNNEGIARLVGSGRRKNGTRKTVIKYGECDNQHIQTIGYIVARNHEGNFNYWAVAQDENGKPLFDSEECPPIYSVVHWTTLYIGDNIEDIKARVNIDCDRGCQI